MTQDQKERILNILANNFCKNIEIRFKRNVPFGFSHLKDDMIGVLSVVADEDPIPYYTFLYKDGRIESFKEPFKKINDDYVVNKDFLSIKLPDFLIYLKTAKLFLDNGKTIHFYFGNRAATLLTKNKDLLWDYKKQTWEAFHNGARYIVNDPIKFVKTNL